MLSASVNNERHKARLPHASSAGVSAVDFFRFKDAVDSEDFDEAGRLLRAIPAVLHGWHNQVPMALWADSPVAFEWLLDQGCDPCLWDATAGASGMSALAQDGKTAALEALLDRFGPDVLRARDSEGLACQGSSDPSEKNLRPGALEICIGRSHFQTLVRLLALCPELARDRPVGDGWRGHEWVDAAKDMSVHLDDCVGLTSSSNRNKMAYVDDAAKAAQILQFLMVVQAAEAAREAVSQVVQARSKGVSHGR